MPTIFERVRKIVANQLGVEEQEIVSNASFVDDLQADSLDLVELIMALEEEFSNADTKFDIPDKDAERIGTLQNAVDYLTDRGVKDEG